MREFFWTDSTVVLGYINNESRRFHVFVANRVQQIRDHTESNQWYHVKTSENPADSVSRGLTAEEFVQNLCWLRGPDFLWKDEIIYNDEQFMNPSELQNDPEVKVQSLAVHMTPVRSHFESERLNYFSDWTRAKKAIAACLLYKSLLKRSLRKPEKTVTSQNDDIGALTRIDALHHAELEIIRAVQYEAFQDELNVPPIRQLRSDQGTNFIGANNEIESAKREMHLKKVQDFLLKENCDFFSFKFNVPSASHMGGIWERQIRTVRSILSSMLNQSGSQLDDESLRTFMCEITAIVNSRPLTTENLYDPQSLEPLTPNHL